MANFKNIATFSPKNISSLTNSKNTPINNITGRIGQTNISRTPLSSLAKNNNQQRKHNFQQRLEVKKLLAARENGAYQDNDFLQKRLERKIANLANEAYGTDTQRLQKSLNHQSGIDRNLPMNSDYSAQSVNTIHPVNNNINNRPVQLYQAVSQPIPTNSAHERNYQLTEETKTNIKNQNAQTQFTPSSQMTRNQSLRNSINELLSKEKS